MHSHAIGYIALHASKGIRPWKRLMLWPWEQFGCLFFSECLVQCVLAFSWREFPFFFFPFNCLQLVINWSTWVLVFIFIDAFTMLAFSCFLYIRWCILALRILAFIILAFSSVLYINWHILAFIILVMFFIYIDVY